MRILDKDALQLDLAAARLRPVEPGAVHAGHPPALRHDPHHGADRIGQDDHALLGHPHHQLARHQHHDRRGSGRVQPQGRQPGAGQRGDRPDVRRRPALLPPPGPGRHPGRRDPRPRDGADRASAPPSPATSSLHAPHQRLPVHGRAAARHGHPALPGLLRADPHPGPAARPEDLQGLQAALRRRRGHPGPVWPCPPGPGPGPALQGQGVPDLQLHGHEGTRGHLRSHADHGRAAGLDAAQCAYRRYSRDGAQARA